MVRRVRGRRPSGLGYLRSFKNKVHQKIISLGSKKAEGYDDVNKERYELDYKLETLEEKKEMLENLFYFKNREFRSAQKGQEFRWQ